MNEGFFKRVRTAVAILVSLLLAFIIISLVSKSPLRTMGLFLFGPLKNVRYLGNVIELTIPLIFAGLSTAILFQANLFNLGAEGIFYFSGLTAAFVAILVPIANPFLHVSAAIAAGAVMGMIVALVPGYLRAKWNASELVSSLMMNSILAGVGLYLLNNFIRDKDLTEIASLKLAPSALLPRIIPRTRIHLGLVICLCFVVGVYLFSRRHRIGYLLRMFGFNHRFVEYSGVSSFSMIIIAHLLAGFIAGWEEAWRSSACTTDFAGHPCRGSASTGRWWRCWPVTNPFRCLAPLSFLPISGPVPISWPGRRMFLRKWFPSYRR